MSALPLSGGEGKGEGMHLQLASNISKQWKILLWMQTLVLNPLPEEQTLQFVSWGIDCIPQRAERWGTEPQASLLEGLCCHGAPWKPHAQMCQSRGGIGSLEASPRITSRNTAGVCERSGSFHQFQMLLCVYL